MDLMPWTLQTDRCGPVGEVHSCCCSCLASSGPLDSTYMSLSLCWNSCHCQAAFRLLKVVRTFVQNIFKICLLQRLFHGGQERPNELITSLELF